MVKIGQCLPSNSRHWPDSRECCF